MTGRIDTSDVKPKPHRCDLPPVRTWDDDVTDETGYPIMHHLAENTHFFCDDCKRIWTVVYRPDEIGHYMVHVGDYEWREENRKMRRQRLDLRWWQRG